MGEDEVVDESFCDLQRTKLNQSFARLVIPVLEQVETVTYKNNNPI